MPRRLRLALCATLLLSPALSPLPAFAQQGSPLNRDIDPSLARLIDSIPAIDNHAHPMLSPPADAADRGFDALPVDNMAPQTDPLAWRPDYPTLALAWKALFNFTGTPPLTPAAQQQLEAARARVKAREGAHYSAYVLDKSGIGTMLANRVFMGTGVEPPRFRWVPYEDALLFPLSNAGLASATPDRAQFFALENQLRARYMAAAKLTSLPPTLDEYTRELVLPTLRHQHAGGAVAAKFELAYLRPLNIGNPTHEQAAAVYARYIHADAPPDPAAYKQLQDYIFRAIAHECGRLGMPVHFHAMAGGGRYFSIAGVDPLNLEPIFNDPGLKDTNFVLLHGGYPFVREAGALLQKPNVYLDFSQQAILFPARTLSTWLREWLELYPDKVLFGTDGYPYSSAMGWEESTWLAARNARNALGLALTGMERDGEITPARAAELARMVLRGNAESLYKFKSK